jgi:DNA replication protein DnaC
MLNEQTIDKLTALQLHGMVEALRQWLDNTKRPQLKPTDLVGLLADAEWIQRENRRLTTRLRLARLRQAACIEDVDYRHPRGLSKSLLLELASSRWVAQHQAVILTGKTGTGKSFLACALAHKACRDGYTVLYKRTSRLFDELAQARADGTYLNALRRIAKIAVLVLDDFGLERLGPPERRALLDVLEDRYDLSSTIVTSQLDPTDWHAVIGDDTAADSICDRLVHNAHRIKLDGESIRKTRSTLTKEEKSTK